MKSLQERLIVEVVYELEEEVVLYLILEVKMTRSSTLVWSWPKFDKSNI